ncbi:M1 family metallopeptidase [Streptomyces chrestomyceticus]|uniref:Aminopeptidase N n=1 Tax=Streptomyces chrestomyceticus TaxID=68185 RepID=A0ABU7WJD6_9ACTN
MRHRLIVPGAAALSLLLAIPASAASYAPGAPGAGDSYYPESGNGGYDVSHYDLRLKYQPTTDLLEGTATLLAKTTQDLNRFNLDFGLKVSEIRVNGKKASFATSGKHELEITPATPLPKGKDISVVVRYAGKPSELKIDGYSAWHRTPDGGVIAQEPDSAVWWFPSNDHPTDKATYDISVSVPDGNQALSNGVLLSQTSKLGWTRFNWRSDKPQAPYLTTLAVGKFDVTKDTTAGGLPVINAVSKDLGSYEGSARASIERTTEVTEWLESVFGPYPFNSVGGYVPNVKAGYALETQTRPFYGKEAFTNGTNVSVVVHEIAHQWYGDSVSVKDWKDIWVNEGFARYSQWLWSEKEGEGTGQELADYVYAQHPADDPFWKVKPGDPGPDNQFSGAVYDRGALTLQALRNEVGDRAFFGLLKSWPTDKKYGNASVRDFVTYAERKTGKPLAALFDAWLFQPSKPSAPALKKAFGARSAAPAKAPAQPKSWKSIQATNTVHDTGHGHRH